MLLTKILNIFFILNFCCLSLLGQIDTPKYKSNCLVCDVYKKGYKKGKVVKNILKAFDDTSIVTIAFEVFDNNETHLPYVPIIFQNTETALKMTYYTDCEGKAVIKVNDGNYKIMVVGFDFFDDTVIINSLSLQTGDIREVVINIGESKCLQARRFHYESYPRGIGYSIGYCVEYQSNFIRCMPSHTEDAANPMPSYSHYDSLKQYYWENNQLQIVAYYHNCERYGTWKYWFPNGRIAKTENYNSSGKIDGIWKTWNQRGDIIEFESYENGIPVGNFCSIAQDPYVVENYSVFRSEKKKDGSEKAMSYNFKTKQITIFYISKNGRIRKKKRPLKVDLTDYEYKISESGDLILQKK